MLLYSWDRGLDVCVDLIGSSPLKQTRMVDFVPGHVVIDVAHRKRVKYEDMMVVRFHCLFVGLSGCHDGSGNGLTKPLLITHLRDRHCNGEAQAIAKHSLLNDLVIFERAESVFGGSLHLVREVLAELPPPLLDVDEE
ncbi:hypothetical protein Tco_1157853, partial [Tanacetum coccineum]